MKVVRAGRHRTGSSRRNLEDLIQDYLSTVPVEAGYKGVVEL